ncbi:VTC domain-containing protein [Saprospiraceae bacterium]|nr:VTC domain-containing protein [Saprospiraceae bacterium]MDB4162808.1 VTC domain-containing protein [Saprospiraceae bacterium]MDC1305637.1 VTC domain-containing protein [Saprospiraceae bacterium]
MRYEIKYRIELLGLASIEAVILMHPASFSTSFPDRQVNNIYLDTPNLHCFYQNIEGVPRRQKMRLRWYGKMDYPQNNSVLEIKNKNAELGWKDSFKISNRSIDTKEELLSAIAEQPVRLDTLTPILHNSYYRKYYISSDGLFRLTIDSEQSFKLPFSNMDALDLSRYPIIVELKYEAEYAERARDIMDYLPFRQTKNSKYTNGVTELLF